MNARIICRVSAFVHIKMEIAAGRNIEINWTRTFQISNHVKWKCIYYDVTDKS